MLRRSGFKRHLYVPPPAPPLRRVERAGVAARIGEAFTTVPKESVIRHEGYRRLVAALPCKHCGIWQYSQCAHGNLGKGGVIKTDDRYSFPLCTVHPDSSGTYVQGCHEKFDQHALFSKAARRLIEPVWAADTRRQILAMHAWPKDLPLWSDE
ncbi:hypothetical protein LJR084_001902 [Variovorax sp. LjRoot84]|uniref:hypothetical protein n=1 Tax=Variovorax sp. LjRoot84 TaxID=3342340 RepID=UPI003ED071DD